MSIFTARHFQGVFWLLCDYVSSNTNCQR